MGPRAETDTNHRTTSERSSKKNSWVRLLRGERHVRLRQLMRMDEDKRAQELSNHSPMDSVKIERNTLGAIFLEEAWGYVQGVRERMIQEGSPSGLGRYGLDDESRLEHVFFGVTKSIGMAGKHFQDTIKYGLNKWEQNEESKGEDDMRVYKRFEELTKKRKETPKDYIYRGAGNAVEVMISVLEVIPEVFKKQYGRNITRDELSEISRNSLSPIISLASINLRPAKDLMGEMGLLPRIYPGMGVFKEEPQAKFFSILNEDGELSLKLNEKKLKKAKNIDEEVIINQEIQNATTGCIALAARTNGKNVVQEMWEDWVLPFAETYYFPAFPNKRQETLISRIKPSSRGLRDNIAA